MERPTKMLNVPAMSHPYTMEMVPPYLSPVLYRVVMPVRMEMMAKENAKLDTTLNRRTEPTRSVDNSHLSKADS